jgi:ribosomal protein L15
LKKNKIISNKIKKVKIINGGELTKTVKIEGLSVSKSVEELINKLGGEVISG